MFCWRRGRQSPSGRGVSLKGDLSGLGMEYTPPATWLLTASWLLLATWLLTASWLLLTTWLLTALWLLLAAWLRTASWLLLAMWLLLATWPC